ncbi:hypothetical protein Acr_00g0081960 [Actinidia rufa]|uniref:Uncharacterized protein n=1 Tax=Actinidia rufa TaxID=165716 RepID=A0A7J0DUM0_9ERIC|nr:hypothetical protein Acr_00g0081960 [Actinidia rufa]
MFDKCDRGWDWTSNLVGLLIRCLISEEVVVLFVVVEIWASNQQSILLDLLRTGPRKIKGRPAQANRNKGPGRGRSKPLRRDDQTKATTAGKIAQRRIVECVQRVELTFERWGSGLFIDGIMGCVHGLRRDPRKDKYGKISRRCRRFNWGDCHLEGIPQVFYLAQGQRGVGTLALWRADEHSDGGSGELSGDSLARSHGLVLPRSRGFGDKQPLKKSWATSFVMMSGRRAYLGR